ncbi:TIGR04282 family arsenosugar biosynthesis glycosyltransferase [Piscinibacter sp. Jin2]|uniref:TIGR04282 family arsenosugar biosynthesis glycosyltransferase n=1 Tax=Aquariibacter lacus TaxID=2801332 RepID=A0A9X1BQF4_9BURK|nr:TIGR04282 family arsenosugar biosynthesis glycosyltransferase [Piscinibacter lacus]MBL0718834.1 TIGR04282 family arsenosugar biosynthesis glycosyltransferase [Piscinibacter lacus]
MPPRFHLTVLAKAPVPGLAKTRLIPALGPEGAAALAERLLDHALDQALAAGFDTVELCVTPDADHPAVQRQAARPGLRLSLQGEGDLGARMARALDRALAGGAAGAVLIGTDAPALDAARLRAAAQALAQADAVTVPAHDGGYALIGLRRPAPALFEGMAWSTAGVLAATRARAAAAGLRLAELAPLHDIDEPADLVHLPAGWLPVGLGVGA